MTKKINPPYKVGDNCYFISKYNKKPKLGEVKRVIATKEGLLYEIVDAIDQRFNIVEHINCADDAKTLKLLRKSKQEENKK